MKKITLARPTFSDLNIERVAQVLKSGNLVQGAQVSEFERKITDYTNSSHAIAVNSATTGLYAALVAAGVSIGDEVIVPAFSYIASANVVEMVHATPVFCDIAPVGFNIDMTKLDGCLTEKTKAVIAVHEFGEPLELELLQKFCEKHELILIEDAACALGTKYNGRHIGNFGFAGVFSFHPRKSITCGDGGVIITNDDLVASKLRSLRNHGLINYGGTSHSFSAIGLNFRLTEMQAALLNTQLSSLDEFIGIKKSHVALYDKFLTKKLLKPNAALNGHSWQSYHILCCSENQRDHIIKVLKESNIFVSLGAQCIPCEPYYREKYKTDLTKYVNAKRANSCGLVLPIHENLTKKDVQFVITKINEEISNVKE